MFTTKRVKTKTLGEYLAAARNRVHLSVEECARLAQIQPKYIYALEEGRFRDLPAGVYAKGFLRSLARVYRIEERTLLQQFESEAQIYRNAEVVPESEKKSINMPRFIWSPRTLTIVGVVLVGLLSFGYLYFQVSSLNRPPRLEVFSPQGDGTVNSGVILVRGQTEAGASLVLNNQPIVVDANGEFRENLSLGPGANQLVIKATNKFGQDSVVTRSIILQEKEIAGSFTSSTPEALDEASLTLQLLIGPQAAWIQLLADGVEQYAGTVLPGAKKMVTAKERIVLMTGNAGSTRVFLGGKDLGVLGKEGEVLRDLEFTR